MSAERLDELLLRWEELAQAGQEVTAENLCRDCPELAEELQRRIDALRGLAWLAEAGSRRNASQFTLLAPGSEPVAGYRLTERLGRGGFAEVWKATGPNGPVALKFIPQTEKAAGVERRSLAVLKHLDHPNLLRTYETWQVNGFLVVAMELADRTLLDRWEEVRPCWPGKREERAAGQAAFREAFHGRRTEGRGMVLNAIADYPLVGTPVVHFARIIRGASRALLVLVNEGAAACIAADGCGRPMRAAVKSGVQRTGRESADGGAGGVVENCRNGRRQPSPGCPGGFADGRLDAPVRTPAIWPFDALPRGVSRAWTPKDWASGAAETGAAGERRHVMPEPPAPTDRARRATALKHSA